MREKLGLVKGQTFLHQCEGTMIASYAPGFTL